MISTTVATNYSHSEVIKIALKSPDLSLGNESGTSLQVFVVKVTKSNLLAAILILKDPGSALFTCTLTV